MKKMFMAVIVLMMTLSASAQFYIYYSDGTVAKVDSISMVAPEETEDSAPSAGIGVFSVSDSKQVTFSKGNLQYHPLNDEWRFAENSTDYIGLDNTHISYYYDGWIDLFGWCGSRTTANFGVNSSSDVSDYTGAFVDWGANKIGEYVPNTWHTLTGDEWHYLLNNRTNADMLVGVAQVSGVNGLVLLPDNWIRPKDVIFKCGFYNGLGSYPDFQILTIDQWSKLEAAGAVFLPAAGLRDGTYVEAVQIHGYYWTSSAIWCGQESANSFDFSCEKAERVYSTSRHYGRSVRLVKYL